MKNLETQCLEKLNKILSRFNLQIVIVKVNQLNLCQYRLVYKNNTANWLALWLSISDILFTRTITIFNCLNSYYHTISNPSFNQLNMNADALSQLQDCSNTYKEIKPLILI